jgi:CubicO group peptidase (beta-lactamase class C family)
MMPSPKKASCGQYFTLEKSFGHTGFTGTSLWWDVEKDWIVILLANRFRPDHDNNLFAKWRPHIHDVAYKVVFS